MFVIQINLTDLYFRIYFLLCRNEYPSELVSRTINYHLSCLKIQQEIFPESCVITFKIPYIIKRSVYLEKNIKQLISFTFSATKFRVNFTSIPMLTREGNDQISRFDKSMVINHLKSYCDITYICHTTRQLSKNLFKNLPKKVYLLALISF